MDRIAEKVAETHVCSMLQIRGYSVTEEREKIATLLQRRHAWTFKELQEESSLPQKSLRRILKLFLDQKLIHYSGNCKAFFGCQKPLKARATSCHSFGICKSCCRVQEFIHDHHSHPRITFMKVVGREHEWTTLCLTCK